MECGGTTEPYSNAKQMPLQPSLTARRTRCHGNEPSLTAMRTGCHGNEPSLTAEPCSTATTTPWQRATLPRTRCHCNRALQHRVQDAIATSRALQHGEPDAITTEPYSTAYKMPLQRASQPAILTAPTWRATAQHYCFYRENTIYVRIPGLSLLNQVQ